MRIIHNGKDYGIWEEENLPRLAEKLGVTIAALKKSSKTATAKASRAAGIDRKVKKRLGAQAKINGVSANVSSITLIVALSILKNVGEVDAKAAIKADLDLAFPEAEGGAVEALMELLGGIMSGEVKTPVAAVGLETAIGQISYCGNETYNILMESAVDAEKKIQGQKTDPVAG